ncbi:helix-turn-helix domain-containing protein [Microbacterium panaciterrae]|uniref:TetR/AcrR family transcriptional regulator n=1 Tax=Microbacterium panaciterrae TaxID=985759 RepID=A0ABP8P9T3_9MICO
MRSDQGERVYDSSRRRAQASRNREAILDIARAEFFANGYASTTMASIAKASGFSVDTVHKAFGGKAGLVRALYERGLGGAGPVPAWVRSDDMQEHERDPHAIVRSWGELSSEVAPLVVPILLLIRDAAASDPEMALLLRQSEDERRERMRRNAHTLADAGHLRSGVALDEAADVLWAYSAPETYERLVLRCGWDASRYGRFVGDALAAALLRPPC